MTRTRTIAGRMARTTTLAGLALAMAVGMSLGCSKKENKSESAAKGDETATPTKKDPPGVVARQRPSLPVMPRMGANRERFRRFAERRAEMMKKYDTNGDGKLDGDERKALQADRIKELFAAVDADKDGKITRKEVDGAADRRSRGLSRRFDRLDADKDGSLTEAELTEGMYRRRVRPDIRKQQPSTAGEKTGSAQ